MTKIKETHKRLTELTRTLEQFVDQEPVSPEVGAFYLTFNNSVVYVFSAEKNEYFEPTLPAEDDANWEQVFNAVILVGGHGFPSMHGEKPPETFNLGCSGYILTHSQAGPEIVLSLREKLPISLAEYR